jgi:hypothetical protein
MLTTACPPRFVQSPLHAMSASQIASDITESSVYLLLRLKNSKSFVLLGTNSLVDPAMSPMIAPIMNVLLREVELIGTDRSLREFLILLKKYFTTVDCNSQDVTMKGRGDSP